MKISASVSPIWRKYSLSEEEIYAELRRCGFRYADYDFSPDNASNGWLRASDPAAWADGLLASLNDTDITFTSAHVGGFNPFDGADACEAVAQAVRCAGAMKIENVVIPLGARPGNPRAEFERGNLDYLRALLPAAQEAGVTLLIEQAGSLLQPHYSHYASELAHLIELLHTPDHLRVSLNVGSICAADIPPYTEIRLLGSLIRHVDASDNFGSMPLGVEPERANLGFAPMMGYMDYDAILAGLCEVGYCGAFNLRMDMPRVFEKNSPYCPQPRLAYMPQHLTSRLHAWSLHTAEYMLNTYHCLDR